MYLMLDGDKCCRDKPIRKGAGAGGGHVLINRPGGKALLRRGDWVKTRKALVPAGKGISAEATHVQTPGRERAWCRKRLCLKYFERGESSLACEDKDSLL